MQATKMKGKPGMIHGLLMIDGGYGQTNRIVSWTKKIISANELLSEIS